MENLPSEEIVRLYDLLLEDRSKRSLQFVYAHKILERNSAAPLSIWSVPNADARQIIDGKLDYNEILFEDNNEVQKGMLFEDQRVFVSEHHPQKPMLCEALDYKPCLQDKCPLFRKKGTKAGGDYGICSEFKIAFQK